jgi:hypothetical protein
MMGCQRSDPPICQVPETIPSIAPDTQVLVELADAAQTMAAGAKRLAYDIASVRDEWERETIRASVTFAGADGWRVGVLGPDGVLTPWSDPAFDAGACREACASARGGGYLDAAVVSPEGIPVQCRGVSLGGSGSVLCGERVAVPILQASSASDSIAFIP